MSFFVKIEKYNIYIIIYSMIFIKNSNVKHGRKQWQSKTCIKVNCINNFKFFQLFTKLFDRKSLKFKIYIYLYIEIKWS